MRNFKYTPCFLFILISCQLHTGSNKELIDAKEKVYQLKLHPTAGSKYHYDIVNESEMAVETEGKKMNISNSSTIGLDYNITKDSTGNFVFSVRYEKIHFKTKNGDTETEMDADNALSTNPAEKVLGLLKDANIVATIAPSGEVKEYKGYKEIGDKIIANFDPNDISGRQIAQQQWEQFLGERLIKNTFEELFKIFPDSAVYIGSKWRLDSKQKGDINLKAKNFFILKDVTPDLSIIESEGDIQSDNTTTKLMGYDIVANVKGKQSAQYEMETKTGMLLSKKVKSKVEGTIQMMGKEIPITIESTVKITGKKMK